MTHIYNITGMTCNGCVAKVKSLLSNVAGVENVSIDLAKGEATIDMQKHVTTTALKSALNDFKYKIEEKNDSPATHHAQAKKENEPPQTHVDKTSNSAAKYHCPMHCEGDKMYDKPGDCPVCGMSLEKVISAPSHPGGAAGKATQYTCPMHPEIVRDAPGSCPICGMDLVPMQPVAEEENKTYKELLKNLK